MFLQLDSVPVPDSISGYLGYMRLRLTEELAWINGSPLYTVMQEGGGGTFRPGDKRLLQVQQQIVPKFGSSNRLAPAEQTLLVQEFLLVTSQLAMSRAQQAALHLVDHMEELAVIPTFVQVCNTLLV